MSILSERRQRDHFKRLTGKYTFAKLHTGETKKKTVTAVDRLSEAGLVVLVIGTVQMYFIRHIIYMIIYIKTYPNRGEMSISGTPKSAVYMREHWNYSLKTFGYTTLLTSSLNFNRYTLCSLL